MRVAYIADARSPIAANWINYFIKRGHDVVVISSYPCPTNILPGAEVLPVPFAFSQLSRVGNDGLIGLEKRRSVLTPLLAAARSGIISNRLRSILQHWLAPFEVYRHIKTVRNLLINRSFDLVHAMRIPFEGIVAANALPFKIPLVTSVWGNDFTLFASQSPLIARQTRQVLQRTTALHCDCRRDLRLARSWKFTSEKPAAVLPGAGGVRTDLFYLGPGDAALRTELQIPSDAPVVINPRGFRQYVCNKTFFQAIPHVLRERPEVIFLCSAMQGNALAEKWIEQLGIARNVRLLPLMPHQRMADIFRLAHITVSPSVHDGTPNTLLESMACGCFPVVGDIESVREWIADGVNGILCDPTCPEPIAHAILHALEDEKLRDAAKVINSRMVCERAEHSKVMSQAEAFYLEGIESFRS